MIRKLAHSLLNIRVARTYVPYQDLENKAMLMDLLESPAGYYDHVRRYTTSLTTQMDYGFRLKTMDDPRAKSMFEV